MQNHSVEEALNMTSLDNFVSTTEIKRDFADQPRYVKNELFSLVKLRVKEDVAELANC